MAPTKPPVIDEEVIRALATIDHVKQDFYFHRESQASVNQSQAVINDDVRTSLENLRLENERRSSDIREVQANARETKALLVEIRDNVKKAPNEFRAWLSALNPYIGWIAVLTVFWLLNQKPPTGP